MRSLGRGLLMLSLLAAPGPASAGDLEGQYFDDVQPSEGPLEQAIEVSRRWILVGAGVLAALLIGGSLWNRALRRQVQARTAAIDARDHQLRELVDNATDMIYRCDLQGIFVFVNPVASRVLGYTQEELLAKRYFELIRPDFVSRAKAFYEAAATTQESTYFEFPVQRRDGSELWVGQHVAPVLSDGRFTGFQGVARDITDRVVAETALKAERDFASAVLDTAPSLVMVLDRHGRLVRFNRACEALSGVSSQSLAGAPSWEMPFVQDEDRAAIRDRIPVLAAATAPVTLDRAWTDASGARHLIAWTISALRNTVGETEALIGVGTDVTVARELDRLKSQFVSMVSHELRTPLTSIRAAMQLMLAEDTPRDPDTVQLLRVALGNAERLIRIVNDILDMSKIEAGEMLMDPVACDVRVIVDESVRSVEAFARDARVGVSTVSSESPSIFVQADPHRTIQILVNLLSNAVKHAPAHSSVEVTVEASKQVARIGVRDHGPGISADKLDVIFEPFTQIDGGDTRRIAGTGLGLTIARALAERQGGGIDVASVEGEGATFTLRLPLASLSAGI